MLGWDDLKERLEINDGTVQCPVRTCRKTVRRQQKRFRTEQPYGCAGESAEPHPAIYISPSTFEYADEAENMLWRDSADLDLWHAIKSVKRESRLARDNSEDAVTWNVFRHLDRHGLLGAFAREVGGVPVGTPRPVYWSWCVRTCQAWLPLVDAAVGFGESRERRSEPDIVVEDDTTLVFVENKLTSGNRTRPSDPENPKRYMTAFGGWYSTVFRTGSDFRAVAVDGRLYELMRLWLIGSRIASEAKKRFILVNVVREGQAPEADIETRFGRHLRQDDDRKFARLTWERIRDRLILAGGECADRERLLSYLGCKSLGYGGRRGGVGIGKLRRAFAPEQSSA